MKTKDQHNPCKAVRSRKGLWGHFKDRVQAQLSDHVATCPRCRKRLAMANRVQMAFDLIKSQPHSLNLLAAANQQATNVLKHSLRNAPKSQKLRQANPEPHWTQKKQPWLEQVVNVAACAAVLLIVRMGLTASLLDVRQTGKTVVHNYYARNLSDTGLMSELFPEDMPQA